MNDGDGQIPSGEMLEAMNVPAWMDLCAKVSASFRIQRREFLLPCVCVCLYVFTVNCCARLCCRPVLPSYVRLSYHPYPRPPAVCTGSDPDPA